MDEHTDNFSSFSVIHSGMSRKIRPCFNLLLRVEFTPCFLADLLGTIPGRIDMKADTHPKYEEVNVKCSCGNTFATRSTYGKDDLSIDVCSECHPFYTGKQKVLDTAGQIDKFNKRFGNK